MPLRRLPKLKLRYMYSPSTAEIFVDERSSKKEQQQYHTNILSNLKKVTVLFLNLRSFQASPRFFQVDQSGYLLSKLLIIGFRTINDAFEWSLRKEISLPSLMQTLCFYIENLDSELALLLSCIIKRKNLNLYSNVCEGGF